MKKVIIILIVLLGILAIIGALNFDAGQKFITKSGMTTAFDVQDIPFKSLLARGDAVGLGKYFGKEVLISIPGKEEDLDKSEAIQLLKDFFLVNDPQSFEIVHQGESPTGKGKYITGKLMTQSGPFRTSIMTEKGLIKELQFDKKK